MTNGQSNDLLKGKLVRLTAIKSEQDAAVMAHWDLDSEYMRHLDSRPHVPHFARSIKDAIEKTQHEDPNTIELAVRTLEGDQLIGFVAFDGINWRQGDTFVGIGIGDPAYRGKGFGADALRVMLRYGFQELNLFRIQLDVFSYNERAIKSYLKLGFVVEGTMRGMLLRDGQRWDFIYMSVLRAEWLARNNEP
jgi:RimJ/RimL family protein N-acetyltransferase